MKAGTLVLLRDIVRDQQLAVRVRGTCMAPAIADGALVRVRSRRIYWPGDVIVAERGGNLLAHRVLGWRARGFVTKGDGCPIHDAPVARHAVLGAVDLPVSFRDRVRALAAFARIAWRRLSS